MLLLGFLALQFLTIQNVQFAEISYNTFVEQANMGNLDSLVVMDGEATGTFKQSVNIGNRQVKNFRIYLPFKDERLFRELVESGVVVKFKPRQIWMDVIISYLPWILILVFLWFLMFRQVNGNVNRAFDFGKSRAKIYTEDRPKVTFDDVADAKEAKEELKEIVDYLKNPQKYASIGARVPKGVLLVGPPGTGKTLLARAIAGEAGVPFISISGSEFVEMFVGVGAARVRDLFEKAKKLAPAIVFIDEIDAVGRVRGAGIGGGHDEREQTLNQLLVEMDGFEPGTGIIVLAATNRPDILDPALLRPGRFDRIVVVDRPDVEGRYEILKVHARKVKLAENVDLKKIAKITPGFSGADLANVINEAALLAARKNKKFVEQEDLEEAVDKVMIGIAREGALSPEEKKRVAYHEAGHAILSKLLPNADPVHKVSVIPRGMALGVTVAIPEEDKRLMTKEYLEDMITVLMGGRVAEKLVFGNLSTGAANDLERVTEIARKMVTEWGMSERLGPATFGKTQREVFLGRDLGLKTPISEETLRIIDEEIKRVVEWAERRAEEILKENIEKLHRLAQVLLEKETISGEELDKIIKDDKEDLPENSKSEEPEHKD
ncbi:ATP-dependent zinc metalloprotease FtsH [Candidatus Caldipriscus sp.]|nr:ATP-dependent zinc metalloprotease FtsH [Candidatus Caldipriscus sp.]